MKKSIIILPIVSIVLLQSTWADCTLEEQNQASQLYQQVFQTPSYAQQIKFLDASLESCYGPEVKADKLLRQGDYSYDNGNYRAAKRYYGSIMQEVDSMRDANIKQKYQLLYYQSMQDVFEQLGVQSQADIMKKKYILTNNHKKNQEIHKSYVDSKAIYQQLAPSSTEKESYLRGVGVVKRKINLSINFEHDSSNLSQKGKKQVKALGVASKQILQENPKGKIEIIGYTSTSGAASYNQKLSKKRARVIKSFLLHWYGIQDTQINYSGQGETSPICSNGKYQEYGGEYSCKGYEDKKASRRVEVNFILE